MTDTTLATDTPAAPEEHAHASERDYVTTALILAAMTAVEVTLSYVHALEGVALVIPLLVVMVLKFVMVAARFMHLKFDNEVLKWVFYSGLMLAVGVYLIALLSFHTFSKDRCSDGTPASAKTCITR